MNTSDLMQAMSDAGAPFEAILIAVRALEARDTVIAEKRAVERDRKRRQRDRDRHGTVTGQSEDIPETPPALDKETSPRPPKEINSTPRARAGSARGSVLPIGWKPEKLSRDTIAGQAIDRRGHDWAKRALETFENHWRAKTGRDAAKRDWQAAWSNWVIEQDRRDGRNGNGQSNPQFGLRGSRPDPAFDLSRYADRLAEEEAASGDSEAYFGGGAALPSYLAG